MKRLRNTTAALYFSLPVQLVIAQVRYQKFVLLCWLFLFLVVTNNFGEMLGIPYLLLEPEYMGEVSFFSMFLLGCGMGTFMMAYMIASYIGTSFRFHFLALEYRPFFVFFLNNMLIPLAFLAMYAVCYIRFQVYLIGEFNWWIVAQLCGFYLGIFMVTLFIFVYFFQTNTNFVHRFGEKVLREMKARRVILAKARAGMGIRIRVDWFFNGWFRATKTDPNEPADFRRLIQVLNQNHGNALFLEFILLCAIMGMGLLEKNPAYQIPAGASILLLLSVILMLIAAFTFWFRRLGPVALLLIVGVYMVFDNFNVIGDRHPALGMNYETQKAAYTTDRMYRIGSEENVQADMANTVDMLNTWRSDFAFFNGRRK
ncbi:MAG: hypothetical protein AAF570_25260, partial [Bacteroidota bacterium]